MKVAIANGSSTYGKWINDDIEVVSFIKDADLVIFTGGPDISPGLYGEKRKHSFTVVNEKRDKSDIFLYEKALEFNKPILAICRGAQFITAMNGGKVVQHINGHALPDGHEIITKNDETYFITSTHHQMMYPYTTKEYEIIALSQPNLSDVYFKNDVSIFGDLKYEPEIVYYKNINALCIQGHPEIMNKNEPVIGYLRRLIKEKLNI
jgi:gamma-glutamyl-gamma-aminobutyrate hydrolase PuuD